MKLTVVVYDNYPDENEGIKPYVECAISGSEEDISDIAAGAETLRPDFTQAEQVARLSTVAAAIRKTVEEYYEQDVKSLPKVVVEGNSDSKQD